MKNKPSKKFKTPTLMMKKKMEFFR